MSHPLDSALLNQLAEQFGIDPEYHDIWGRRHVVTDSAKQSILAAMGVSVGSTEDIERELAALLEQAWGSVCDPVLVMTVDRLADARWSFRMPTPAGEDGEVHILWELWDERGQRVCRGSEGPGLHARESRIVGGRRIVRFDLPLPSGLELGYYDLKACSMSRSETAEGTCRLIIAPRQCYLPPRFEAAQTIWGLSTQLYSLRSSRNWGVGDFGDLHELQDWAAQELGADMIGLNPLHALRNSKPYHISPYSPDSRLYLNVLYVDVERIPEFKESAAAQAIVREAGFCYRLESLRASELVEYEEVWAAKRKVLTALFETFRERHLTSDRPAQGRTERGRAFQRYLEQEGETLERFALFQVLSEEIRRSRPTAWVWQDWPEVYRDPASPAVAEFRRSHGRQVLFQQYLQWVTAEQLKEVADRGSSLGMAIGLYRDFALGSDRGGSDAWIFHDVLALDADCGAPPDAFAPEGQNWGLPPINPARLRAAAYRPFIELLRKNVQYGGALRLDHVMALFRLFWIPRGLPAAAGAYVRYPAEDLLNILALESVRWQVVIIGEDLGTVPEGIRERLAAARVLSYRVFYFERGPDADWKPPAAYPAQAMAVATTHDLPTVAGFWKAEDVHLRASLGFFKEREALDQALAERLADKRRILAALARQGLLPRGLSEDPATIPQMTPALAAAIHAYLARTPSWIVLVAVEDLIGEEAQANLPGTVEAHPNWCRKLSLTVEEIRKDPRPRELATLLRAARAAQPDSTHPLQP